MENRGELVPLNTQIKTVASELSREDFKGQLQMALPRVGITPDRMVRIALTEVRRTPKLARCTIESLMGALLQCAQYGLEPGPMGLSYIIPYGAEAQFQLGYRGLLQLIWQSDRIASVQSEVVYESDFFEYSNGIPPDLRHRPADGERGKPTHVYAVIGTTSGGWIFRVMTFDEIEEHREKFSKTTKRDTPWFTDWGEMACKTVLKRTGKRAPVSTDAQAAITLDDKAERGIAQHIDIELAEPAESDKEDSEEDAGEEVERDPETGDPIPPDAGIEM